jgi:hypothetical protein
MKPGKLKTEISEVMLNFLLSSFLKNSPPWQLWNIVKFLTWSISFHKQMGANVGKSVPLCTFSFVKGPDRTYLTGSFGL